MVWWQHPRYDYRKAIESLAFEEAGDDPHDDWLYEGGTQSYKKVGKSGKRKKPSFYTSREMSAEQRLYYDKVSQIEGRLTREGIDHQVPLSWKWERLSWAMGVSLVAPMEVRCEKDLAEVARLARALIFQQTTLPREFPDFVYDRAGWLLCRVTFKPATVLYVHSPIGIALMVNIASVFKAETSRIARKEVRAEVESLKKANSQHRSAIAELRRELAALQKQLKQAQRERASSDAKEKATDRKYRFSAARMAAHRSRLGLSAADYGRLISMSGATIYLWEQGKARPKPEQVQQLGELKHRSGKEILARLAQAKASKSGQPPPK